MIDYIKELEDFITKFLIPNCKTPLPKDYKYLVDIISTRKKVPRILQKYESSRKTS